MAIDYKLLLSKYIEHVGASEGATFINSLYASDGQFEGASDRVSFSAEEVAALNECEQHFIGAPALEAKREDA